LKNEPVRFAVFNLALLSRAQRQFILWSRQQIEPRDRWV